MCNLSTVGSKLPCVCHGQRMMIERVDELQPQAECSAHMLNWNCRLGIKANLISPSTCALLNPAQARLAGCRCMLGHT